MAIHEFETREFGDGVKDPDVTVGRIEAETHATGLLPVLWIEEIDRFPTTESRMDHLFRLIDSVYERGGTIITTANATPAELTEKFDPALLRRVLGDNDEGYVLWDLHRAAKRFPGKTAKAA